MDEPISDMASRVQAACSTTDSTIFEDAANDVERVQAALVQAQLSLADASLFSLVRLKGYVTISQNCKATLLELQHLIDYYSRPGWATIRNDGVLVTLGHLRSCLQISVRELDSMDALKNGEESDHDGNQLNTMAVPIIQISSPVSPIQAQLEGAILLHIDTDKPALTKTPFDSPHPTTIETTATNLEWDATQATDVQRWSQSSFFQISLETVLEEFDDTRSESDSSVYSKSSASSRSSGSERTVTPPPMHSREAFTRDHRASVEIVYDVSSPYTQEILSEESEFESATLQVTVPVAKLSPSFEGLQPDFDQYSPSFQLKKRSKEIKPRLIEITEMQPTLGKQSPVDMEQTAPLIVRRQTKRARRTQGMIQLQRQSQDDVTDEIKRPEGASIDTLTDFDWLDEELAIAEQKSSPEPSPIVHPAALNPVERKSTPFVHPRTKYMSIAHCNTSHRTSQRSKSFPLPPPPPPFHPRPAQRHNSLPVNTIENPTSPSAQSFTSSIGPKQSLYPISKPQRCQSTDLAHLPLRNNLFSQSVPNLHSSIPASRRTSTPDNPPSRPPPPPPLPLWMSTNSVDDATTDIHVANSKPVFMEGLRGLRISFQPPPQPSSVKGRRSFQRLSSMFQRPKVADSFFNHSPL